MVNGTTELPSTSGAGRVLIIDDDEMVSVVLYDYLKTAGVNVDRAVEPRSGLEAAAKGKYDLVIVDAFLTGQHQQTALELLSGIGRLQPNARKLLMTAYGSDGFVESAREIGEVTVMEKPKPVSAMAATIMALLPTGTT